MNYIEKILKSKKYLFTFFIILLYSFANLHSQQNIGINLTRQLCQKLENDNFAFTTQNLSEGAEASFFPQNIIVSYYSENKTENNIIIDIMQEDALQLYENVINPFLQKLKQTKSYCNINIVFTANNQSFLDFKKSTSGTNTYIQNLNFSEKDTAIVLDFSDKITKTKIITGSSGKTTPYYLTKSIEEVFSENNIKKIMPDFFIAIFNMNIASENIRLGLYLSNEIPSFSITFNPQSNDISTIINFCQKYEGTKEEWDNHYIRLNYKNHKIWITERIFAISFIIILTISLFLICEISFLVGKNKIQIRKAFIQTWIFLPITLLLTITALYIGQYIASLVYVKYQLSSILLFGIKILTAFLITAMLYIFQARIFIIPYSQYSFAFLLNIVMITNLCIFGLFNITLVILFFFQYIISYIFRAARRIVPLIFAAIFIIIPYIPYAIDFFRFSDRQKIITFINSPLHINILIGLLLLPLQLIWVRILIRKFKVILHFAFLLLLIFISISFFGFYQLSKLENKFNTSNISKENKITEAQQDFISLKTSESLFLNVYTRYISISSKYEIIRYNIKINTQQGIPIYDSSYNYETDNESHCATFVIPDYPAKELRLNYTTDNTYDSIITIEAWAFDDNANIVHLKKSQDLFTETKR